jgi:uncharacterized repeat protein (TIGR03943 family)
MREKLIPLARMSLLLLLAVFLAEKYFSGKLFYYIGPRFSWLTLLAIGCLLALAVASFVAFRAKTAHDHEHDHHDHDHAHDSPSLWPLMVVAVPLLLGFVIPARPLGASAIGSRGVSTDVGLASDKATRLTIVSSERNILDWVRLINNTTDPAELNGQEANVLGFVYRDPRFADNQFMVARFTLTCCVADALAIGIVVTDDNAQQFTQDTWVQVKGTFTVGDLDGKAMPVLLADEITPVPEPEQPYLFP